MRILVFLLVLANLSFFAWARGYLGSGETAALRAGEPLRADHIRIVSNDRPPKETQERKEEALPPAKPQLPVETPPIAEPPRKEICVALDDVPQAEADAIERLFAGNLPSFTLARATAPGNSSYWVLIPLLRTRRDAENKVAELKNRGVRDYYIMPEGNGFAVSLGLFSTRGAAESALAALREKRVRSVRLIERPRRTGLARIEIRGPEAQDAEMRQALVQAWPQARPEACDRNTAP